MVIRPFHSLSDWGGGVGHPLFLSGKLRSSAQRHPLIIYAYKLCVVWFIFRAFGCVASVISCGHFIPVDIGWFVGSEQACKNDEVPCLSLDGLHLLQ